MVFLRILLFIIDVIDFLEIMDNRAVRMTNILQYPIRLPEMTTLSGHKHTE